MERISQAQVIRLFTIYLFSSPVGFLIAPLTELGGFQGWMGLVIGSAGALLAAYFGIVLGRIEPAGQWLKFGSRIVGKWVHIPVLILFSFFAIHLCAIAVRKYVDFFTSIYMPDTPSWVLALIIGLCAALAVRSGLEAIARFAETIFLLTIVLGVAIPFFVGKELQTDMAIAFVTHYDFKRILDSSVFTFPWFGEMFYIVVLMANVKEPQKTMRSMTIAWLFTMMFVLMTWLFCMMLFGPKLNAHLTYPVLEMLRFIRIGDFLENVDPLLVSWWTMSVLVKASLLLYVSTLGVSHIVNVRDYRPLSFSIGIFMTALSMGIATNYGELEHFLNSPSWTTYIYFMELLPVLYLLVYWLRGKKLSPG
ncbi:endospore germination permease [Paenibacillus sp. MBLB4367]|uniref:GerAB/ArcD/ProY family transporter n=1 Tax=Paenibacillus sp. MBLB4367 TaxID=3384767 RepID=UPI003907EE0D